MRVGNQNKSNSVLLLKLFHKTNLMFMYIGKWKSVRIAFLRIKTNRNPLHGTNIINRTLLIKIGKCNMTGFLINIDWCNRSRDFLDQRQSIR